MTDIVYNKNGVPFDIDALATDVNGKADRDLVNVSSNASVCIESWHEGTEWYRVYSDGWCEQGGYTTVDEFGAVNLPREYIDTNYTVILTVKYNASGTGFVKIGTLYTNRFTLDRADASYGAYWEAKGYIR
jgi:hypothetical protein